MGFGLRQFLVMEDGSIKRTANRKLTRMFNHDPKERLPQYSNKRVRLAEIGIEYLGRIPIEIVWTNFGYLRFDSDGRIDRSEHWHLLEAALSFMEESPILRGGVGKNVIDARQRFRERAAAAKYLWKPTPEILISIRKAIFGR